MADERRRALIRRARGEHGRIEPCASRHSLEECFSQEGQDLMFWFNTADGSTRVLVEGRVV